MRITPDQVASAGDQHRVTRLVRACLTRVLPPDEAAGLRPSYPGLVAAAHQAQRLWRVCEPPPAIRERFAADLRTVAVRARASDRRAARWRCADWWVDLPPPEPHLDESLARALKQIPPRSDEAPVTVTVTPWDPAHREVLRAATALLSAAWPQMLAEISTVVRQVALLDGWGIDGFTDFTTHGAIFVNSRRLRPADDGPPPEVRLAEALVHEATHSRCNAAALATPFLTADGHGDRSLLATPLRADPRPLAGLFQQVVVLARSVVAYDQILAGPMPSDEAVRARRELLAAQGRRGAQTALAHRAGLSEEGRCLIEEAEELLKEGRPASPAQRHPAARLKDASA